MGAVTPADDYKLKDVGVAVEAGKLRIRAQCCGPHRAMVWVRAWLSNETGTLAEAALDPVSAGTMVSIEVRIPKNLPPHERYTAFIRIESSPLKTRQVVGVPLDYSILVSDKR